MPMNLPERIQYILQTAGRKLTEADLLDNSLIWTPDTVLLGKGACLDSMGFVNFIVAVEDSIDRDFGIAINLSEELVGSTVGNDSTLTLRDLADFLTDVVRQRHGRNL
jgi:acyl carrier protein